MEESLDDLNNLDFGSDLAGMVSNPSIAQPVKNVPTSATTTSTSNSASDMPSDISDLRSSDLLQSLSGVDIDRMFADFQAEASNQQQNQQPTEVNKFFFSKFQKKILNSKYLK